jgi:hypothetical protein
MQIALRNGKPIWKAAWADVGGKRCFFRSKWEYNYACFLQYLKEDSKIIDWEHESDTFWFEKIKRGVRSYTPDFKVTHLNGSIEFVEVKGHMDSKSQTKLKRMGIYFQNIKIRVVDAEWFKQNNRSYKNIIKGWWK